MKRDLQLIKKILSKTEEIEANTIQLSDFSVEGYDQNVVYEHVQLLNEAQFVKAAILKTDQSGIVKVIVHRLTWDGHEFLESLKNEKAWEKAKNLVKDKGQNIPFSILREILSSLIRTSVGLS